MKKLFFAVLILFGLQSIASAQFSKADVDQMMKELGTSEDKIETLYIGNTLVFYKDGSYKKTYEKYTKVNGDYGNSVKITESGILLKTTKGGKLHSVKLLPYKSISNIYISMNYLEVYLKD
jgi:hypothetical protein